MRHDAEDLPRRFSGIVFDCDGTLVDTAPAYHRSYQRLLRERGASMPASWYDARRGLSERALLRTFAAEFGVELDPEALMAPLAEAYRGELPHLREIGVVAAIARRWAGRLPMAVASAGNREIVEATLDAVGLLGLFQAVVTVEDVEGRSKPEPDLFLEAARRLGVAAAGCAAFEDTDEGLEAARRAGMHVTDVRTMEGYGGAA